MVKFKTLQKMVESQPLKRLSRRSFVRNSLYASALGYLNTLPLGMPGDELISLTILHTNDVHSRIDPFPMDSGRNAGQGGVAKRATMIDQIRQESQHVLLFDAGDMFQGTPYFNMFNGELEIKLMSQLGYDAGTIGNHDFDAGIDELSSQLRHANFPLIASNYNFDDNAMYGKALRKKVFEVEEVKIGVYGLGIELKGLVPDILYKGTRYLDPLKVARQMEDELIDEGCDYVICLSHLGYRYRSEKISDVVLASQSRYTDLIIGGHTHTFMKEPHIERNLKGEPVIINQAGFGGILMGRIDLAFGKERKNKQINTVNLTVE